VDYFQYCQSIGNIGLWSLNLYGDSHNTPAGLMNPLKPYTTDKYPAAGSAKDLFFNFYLKNPIYGMNFYALLGHNMAGIGIALKASYLIMNWADYDLHYIDDPIVYSSDNKYFTYSGSNLFAQSIINFEDDLSGYQKAPMNGFSILEFDEMPSSMATKIVTGSPSGQYDGLYAELSRYTLRLAGSSLINNDSSYGTGALEDTNGVYKSGGIPLVGRIFDFEHSPDMKITMERDSDGIQVQKTLGGTDITNISYLGPPSWPMAGNPWTLTPTNTTSNSPGVAVPPLLGARMGRRKWNLKFSMLSDHIFSDNIHSGLFSLNESTTLFGADTTDAAGYVSGDDVTEDGSNEFKSDIWDDSSFMGLVYQKTMGFSLPFLWQPDSNNNSPDQFCLAKIENFKMRASSFKKYDISFTVREIW